MAAKSNLLNMTVVLTATCLVCSALLGLVQHVTAEPIENTNRMLLNESISAVAPDGVQISDAKPLTVGGKESQYYECSKDGSVVSYAIRSTVTGFGGPLTLMVGVTPDGKIYNASVLSHSETPGLGAKCTQDEHFMAQWKDFDPSSKILAVKKDGGDVDAITASTITSRAYTLAVKNAVEAFKTINGGE